MRWRPGAVQPLPCSFDLYFCRTLGAVGWFIPAAPQILRNVLHYKVTVAVASLGDRRFSSPL